MSTKYFVIVAAMAAVLVGATAIATADSAFAGGKEKNQATPQANACGNDFMPINVGCQNTGSQIQGDENIVALTSQQTFPGLVEEHHSPHTPQDEICDDGVDNDGDGFVDLQDPDCEKAEPIE